MEKVRAALAANPGGAAEGAKGGDLSAVVQPAAAQAVATLAPAAPSDSLLGVSGQAGNLAPPSQAPEPESHRGSQAGSVMSRVQRRMGDSLQNEPLNKRARTAASDTSRRSSLLGDVPADVLTPDTSTNVSLQMTLGEANSLNALLEQLQQAKSVENAALLSDTTGATVASVQHRLVERITKAAEEETKLSLDEARTRLADNASSLAGRIAAFPDVEAATDAGMSLLTLRAKLAATPVLHPIALVGDVPVTGGWNAGRIITPTPSDLGVQLYEPLMVDAVLTVDDNATIDPSVGPLACIGNVPGGAIRYTILESASTAHLGAATSDWTFQRCRHLFIMCSGESQIHEIHRTLSAQANLQLVVGIDPSYALATSRTGPSELKSLVASLGYGPGLARTPGDIITLAEQAKGTSPFVDLTSTLMVAWLHVFTAALVEYAERGNVALAFRPIGAAWPGGAANYGAAHPVPAAGVFHVYGGTTVQNQMLANGIEYVRLHANDDLLVLIANSCEEVTPQFMRCALTLYYGRQYRIGWAANTAVPGGRNVHNGVQGLDLWLTHYTVPPFVGIVILIKGGMTAAQWGAIPIPGQANLPGGAWPPGAPNEMVTRQMMLAFIDAQVAQFGVLSQCVAACELAITCTKAFPNPSTFGTGGQEDSETHASEQARLAAIAQNEADADAHRVLEDAYEAALPPPAQAANRAAAIAPGAAGAGLAVDPPHPGVFHPGAVPAIARPGNDPAGAEAIPNVQQCRSVVDVLMRPQVFRTPKPSFAGAADAIGRSAEAVSHDARMCKAYTDTYRIADIKSLASRIALLNDGFAYAFQCAMRAKMLTVRDLYPNDAVHAAPAAAAQVGVPNPPPALPAARLLYRDDVIERQSTASKYFTYNLLAEETVRQYAMRTPYLMGPLVAATIGHSHGNTRESGFQANSPYGICHTDDCVRFLTNGESPLVRLPSAAFGSHGHSAARFGREYTAGEPGKGQHLLFWSREAAQRNTLVLPYERRVFNRGFCEPSLGAATIDTAFAANAHGMGTQLMPVELVLKRLAVEMDEIPQIRAPVKHNRHSTFNNRRVPGDFPIACTDRKRIYDIRLTNVPNRFYSNLQASNEITGSYITGYFERAVSRVGNSDTNSLAPHPFRFSDPFAADHRSPDMLMTEEALFESGLSSIGF